VRLGDSFDLFGRYRVQSKRAGHPSRLTGRWTNAMIGGVNSDVINNRLRSDPAWRGGALVNIRPALVEHREGEFAEEHDILYKRSHFERAPESDEMTSDLVDVRKAAERWIGRRPHIEALFGTEVTSILEARIGDVEKVAALEYYVHEGGHCLGYDTTKKHRDGYFQLEGKTVWPLVYVEELRADLLSFGMAADLAPADLAAAAFLYNILLRIGSHREGVLRDGRHPYGAIPHMLFTLLRRVGFFHIPEASGRNGQIEIAKMDDEKILQIMRHLSNHAQAVLVESRDKSGTDAALQAAEFYRQTMEAECVDTFKSVVESA